MTLTPCCPANFSMEEPTPESSPSMSSTVAPAVMSACAWVSSVWSLAWALSILYWLEVSPAFWNASVRYGASKETYRADDAVSGRSAPIIPWPWDARPFRLVITEKSLVNDVAEMFVGVLLPLVVVVLDELGELLQAAATMPTTSTSDIPANRLNPRIRMLPSCSLFYVALGVWALRLSGPPPAEPRRSHCWCQSCVLGVRAAALPRQGKKPLVTGFERFARPPGRAFLAVTPEKPSRPVRHALAITSFTRSQASLVPGSDRSRRCATPHR